jgi:hypothetical protein
MRNFLSLLALALILIGAPSASVFAGCNAPYTGCLAACGNKVTSGGSAGTIKAECKANCLAKKRECERGCRRGFC